MKLQIRNKPIPVLISSVLLLAGGVFSLWIGIFSIISFPAFTVALNASGIVSLVIAVLLVIFGYFVLAQRNLEVTFFVSAGIGLTMIAWLGATGKASFELVFQGIIPLIAGAIAFSQEKAVRKRIWLRRTKNFWEDFSHNRVGIAGLIIVLLYAGAAIAESQLALYDPEQRGLADNYAMPEWMTIVNPALANLPRTTAYSLDWQIPPDVTIPGLIIREENKTWTILYEGNDTVTVPLIATFNYPYDPPDRFTYRFQWGAKMATVEAKPATRYSLEINLTKPDNTVIPLWDQHWWEYKAASCVMPNPYYEVGVDPIERRFYPGRPQYDAYWKYKEKPWQLNYTLRPAYGIYQEWGIPVPRWTGTKTKTDVTYTVTVYPPVRLGFETYQTIPMTRHLFSHVGNYTVQAYATFEPIMPDAPEANMITLSSFTVLVPGRVWGLLGTQAQGKDCWSRLIYGARISLMVGLSAAIIATSIGLLIGVISGYKGGLTDESLMRLVDVLLCLPVLPLLLVLVTFWGRNILYIIVIIAIFGWQGLARVIRSQVLSIRELPFVESARASGGSSAYVMIRHIIPNVLPIFIASMILSIPGAILLEAGLSFIGFGDPSVPTWGREFSIMQTEATTPWDAWWWMFPPGIAITILCVAFVFMGHAIDEIINPKLRRRR